MLHISPILQDNLALEQATSLIHSHTFIFFSPLFKNKAAPQGRQSCLHSSTARTVCMSVLLNRRQQLQSSNDSFTDYLHHRVIDE